MSEITLTIVTLLLVGSGLLAWHHFFGTKREREFERNRKKQPRAHNRLANPAPREDQATLDYLNSHGFYTKTPENPQATFASFARADHMHTINTATIDDLLKRVEKMVDVKTMSLEQMLSEINLDDLTEHLEQKIKAKTRSTGGR